MSACEIGRKGLTDTLRKSHLILLAVGLCLGLFQTAAWACRYNVLEVGYIDLGIEPYRLYGYATDEVPAETVSSWREDIETSLVDTNVQFELVNPDRQTDHPALDYLGRHDIETFPAAILVSPEGQSLPIVSGGSPMPVGTSLDAALASPLRAEILKKVAGCYGVVLVIEGPDEAANTEARQAAEAAVTQVGVQMEFMPKAIAAPPEVLTLPAESLGDEAVLLWSLDAKPADINEPHAAIFYGRGRWIGPLFRGEQITKENLERVLFVIGADCECGLDHRWLQGTMLPARWDGLLQTVVAKTLGFDPESPLVKMEMISIVRRGMGGAAVPGVAFGYREIEIGGEEIDDEPVEVVEEKVTPHDSVPEIPEAAMPAAEVNEPAREQNPALEEVTPMPLVAWGLGGVAVCVVAVGMVIVMRSRKA